MKVFKALLILFLFLGQAFPFALATTPEELKNAIEEKSKSLEDINGKLRAINQVYQETQDKGKSLNKELRQIDGSIKTLDLHIRGSEINIQKINLELESLQYKIKEAEEKISVKKDAIANILRQIHEGDREEVFIKMLKNDTLADSVIEMQNLSDLGFNLGTDLKVLKGYHEEQTTYLNEANDKKDEIELEDRNLKNRKLIVENQKLERKKLLDQTKNQEKVYESIISDLEKQQQAVSDEISKIEDELRAKFDVTLLPSKRPGVFMWPVKNSDGGRGGVITQHFGERSRLYGGKPHNGLDIGTPIGTPIFVAEDGKVVAVDNNDRSFRYKYQYGKYVLIQHSNNLMTLYAHLSSQVATVGATVKRGDLIGYSGNTGYSTGAHLHFGVYWAPSVIMRAVSPAAGLVPIGVVINPEDYL